ncbi:hypothetical protein [Allosediminivita pacifica]|uniref:Uncharacterized protein n=1 Tax=Allosediminivita pacifica TaxID=1267769 RepID=A0A2T6ACM1_9RHOB|nr:hypothetical protein [Allosediminivita pacifica]PTX41532.1 hypothetical protein C8N44_12816 [Allosediminivita pacifica]GGB23171.1 hypothetical protein GCM10011324_36560 [Allosediminivita pacifica]
MTERLFDRIETLRTEIEAADAGKRAVLITRLEQMVDMLSAKGQRPPAWARDTLRDYEDDSVEDRFDNMPI